MQLPEIVACSMMDMLTKRNRRCRSAERRDMFSSSCKNQIVLETFGTNHEQGDT